MPQLTGRRHLRAAAAAAAATQLLLLSCLLLAPGRAQAARTYSLGDVRIGGGSPGIGARAQFAAMPPACAASATADFEQRLALPQWDAQSASGARAYTGPFLRVYPGPPKVRCAIAPGARACCGDTVACQHPTDSSAARSRGPAPWPCRCPLAAARRRGRGTGCWRRFKRRSPWTSTTVSAAGAGHMCVYVCVHAGVCARLQHTVSLDSAHVARLSRRRRPQATIMPRRTTRPRASALSARPSTRRTRWSPPAARSACATPPASRAASSPGVVSAAAAGWRRVR